MAVFINGVMEEMKKTPENLGFTRSFGVFNFYYSCG